MPARLTIKHEGPGRGSGRTRRHRRRNGLLAGLVGIVALLAMAISAPAASAAPWSCTSFGYLFQSPNGLGNLPHDVFKVDLATGESEPLPGGTESDVNATAFNVVDNFMYGWNGETSEIVRIEDDLTEVPLGLPVGVDPEPFYNIGDIDAAGNYWMSSGAGIWYEIDLTTTPPTVLNTGTRTNTTGLAASADWAWIGGILYQMGFDSVTRELHLMTFDPATGVTSDAGAAGVKIPAEATGFGAVYADANGNLYGSDNGTGQIFRINTATHKGIKVANGPKSAENDGARCANAPIPTLTLSKTVEGRVRPADQFTVGLVNPNGEAVESATTTGTGTTASTTNFPASQTKTYTITDAMAANSPSKLGEYVQSIKCVDSAGKAAPTGGSTGKWTLLIAEASEYTCNVTNKAEADLSLTKTSSSPVVPGEEATFTLKVSNKGPSTSIGETITDPLPKEFTFGSASQGCTNANGTVSCPVGELKAGASKSFEIKGKAAGSLKHCLANTATVSGAHDPDMSNNKASTCGALKGKADLSIEKKSSAPAVLPGGQITYTLVIKNKGPSDATGVKVEDAMPTGLTLASANPSQGKCSSTGNEVLCNLGNLAAGGSAQVLVTATVTGKTGTITNKAKVHGDQEDPEEKNNEEEKTITVPGGGQSSSDLVVTKTSNVKHPTVGQVVTYKVVVKNNGPDAAPNAKATDTYNAPAQLLSVKPSAGTCSKHIPIHCELGTIQPGAKVTIMVKMRPAQVGGNQRNAASATSEGKDPNPENNLDVLKQRVSKVKLKLTKVASKANVHPGEKFSYLIRVKNITKGIAKKVKVCDRMPSGLAYLGSTPKGKLSKGKLCWTVKRLGPKKAKAVTVMVKALSAGGTKVNRVTATGPDAVKAKAKSAVHVAPAPAKETPVTG